MSRGVVLWPDQTSSQTIRDLWNLLADHGVPSMASHTHRLHQPHVSLIVAEHLPVRAALDAVGPVPPRPIRLLIEAAGVFPGGFLYLAVVPSAELLDEQRRVHEAVRSLAIEPWPHFEPGIWTPHITTGWALTDEQVAEALPLVLDCLPIEGSLDTGGVEDGGTGERWTGAGEAPLGSCDS
jgi:hypothetical protein